MTRLRNLATALAALAFLAAPPAFAADRPLVQITGQTKQLPNGHTLQTAAATTANASANMPHGTAPSSPVDGDLWTTTAGLYLRINGATVGPVGAGGGSGTVTSVTCGTGLSGGVITTTGTCSLTAPVTVALGGTNATSASGTALDNITGFASTGFLTRTGSGTYAFQSATNGVTLGNLAQVAANRVLGNATGSTANVAALAMPSCSGTFDALKWTSASGFGCNTISVSGGGGGSVAGSQDIQEFTANGTWNMPSGAKSVRVIVVGGGGGGGNGSAGTNASNRGGGGGGSGGGMAFGDFQASVLPSSVTITIPAASGAATVGGTASFGSFVLALGGDSGANGSTVGGNGGGSGVSQGTLFQGNTGGNGSSNTTGLDGKALSISGFGGGGGGGGGGGLSTTGTVVGGGAGSRPLQRGLGLAGGGPAGAAAVSGTAGTDSSTTAVAFMPGDGAGGGAVGTSTNGGAGGAGKYGGGGGGGGGARSPSTGGVGGAGGAGVVWVITTF